jgi:hypothetical protein
LKQLKFGLIPALLLLLASCSNDSQAMLKVSLAPVPYSIEVPAEIAKHLSIENMVTSAPSEFTNQAREAGAIAQVYINYKAADGTMHGFAGVYYFKKADFEKAQNPNEPPVYGSKVVEENSMVVLIAGPQESMFDPNSQDDKNSAALYTLVYDPNSFKSLPAKS